MNVWLLESISFTPNLCGERMGIYSTKERAQAKAESLFQSKYPDDTFEWRDDDTARMYRDVPDDWEAVVEFEIIPFTLDT